MIAKKSICIRLLYTNKERAYCWENGFLAYCRKPQGLLKSVSSLELIFDIYLPKQGIGFQITSCANVDQFTYLV